MIRWREAGPWRMGPTDGVRVGVIGTGFGARVVAPVFRTTEGCEVVDVVSPRDEAAVGALCARGDVDLISVQSPPFLHLDHVRQAVESGHAVLCDKPFGRNAEEAGAMCDLAHRAGVLNFVNYEFRVHPVRQRLREFVRDGAIGPVEHVQWTAWLAAWHPAADRKFGWSFDADLGGGWVRVWGSHQIDYLRWTFGEITEATAAVRTTVAERVDPDGHARRCTAETGFTANVRSETGVTITLDSSATAAVERPSRVIVIGRDGVLEMRSDNPHEIGGWIELHTDAGSTEVFRVDQHGDNHRLEMAPYAEVVRDGIRNGAVGPDVPTFVDGAACAAIMDNLTPRPANFASEE
jgi:predicted dehydrogenase